MGDIIHDVDDLGIKFDKVEDFVKEKPAEELEGDKFVKKYLE